MVDKDKVRVYTEEIAQRERETRGVGDLTPGEIVARSIGSGAFVDDGTLVRRVVPDPSVPGRTPGDHAPGTEDSHYPEQCSPGNPCWEGNSNPSPPLAEAYAEALERETRARVADEVDPIPYSLGLPTEAKERKALPMATGVLDYFPDALAAVAELSRVGNEQHNPGQPLHWAKEKSTDHADCIVRHLVDRGTIDTDGIRHSAKVAWRALALLQIEIESGQGR